MPRLSGCDRTQNPYIRPGFHSFLIRFYLQLNIDPRQQLAAMQAQIIQLQSEIQALHLHSCPKPALPDPDKFNSSTQRFDIWLLLIRAKLRVDGMAIGDPIAQFYYVFLNLDSHIQAIVLLQLA